LWNCKRRSVRAFLLEAREGGALAAQSAKNGFHAPP
jgi:hypothetical protein